MNPKPIVPLILLVCLVPGLVAAADPVMIPAPPEVGAKAYVLEDANSGRVLAQSNADQRLEPASLTKIMTAFVVFTELAKGNLKLTDMVTVSEKAWRTEGSRMFAQVGAKIDVEHLLKGMIVQSGNDASVALAEHIGGDESVFVQMMNRNAEQLGMKDTHYRNSMGLPDPDHYTTARDMAVLTRTMIERFPVYYKWHSIKEFEFNGIKQINRNRLLWRDPSVDGVKTGHTESAGYCLVSSAVRDNMRLLAVVLGTRSDNERANANQALLNYGFRFFETRPLYKTGDTLTEVRVWKGAETTLSLTPAHNFFVTFPKGQYQNLKAALETEKMITAPIQQGARLGFIRVNYNNEVVAQADLVASKAVETGGFFRQLIDQIQMTFK
jgi:D-alanyl-D-alanine carboxypeptidase (penicillin-binding protein 5/6)